MPFSDKAILVDRNGRPIPQYFNATADNFQDLRGRNGAAFAELLGSSEVLAGEKVVALAATPEALAATAASRGVTIQAKSNNTGLVRIGNASAQHVELAAGESIAIMVADLALVFVAVDLDGEGVNFVGVG